MKTLSENIVDNILMNDKESFMQAFNAAISAKVSDALELKKVEIASSLVVPDEIATEVTTASETSSENSQSNEV